MNGNRCETPPTLRRLNCSLCGVCPPKTADYNVTGNRRVVCSECACVPGNHHRLFPECGVIWHDLWDHLELGTLAWAWGAMHPAVCGCSARPDYEPHDLTEG